MRMAFSRVRRFIGAHPIALAVAMYAVFSAIFYVISPETIIEYAGVENAYLFMAILAFVGGVSTFSGVPYQLVLIALAAGGLNPWILGPVTGLAVIAGDSTSYFIGKQTRGLIKESTFAKIARVRRWYEKHPRTMPLAFLAYGTFCPLPNDVLTIPMGMLGYPFWRMMIPLGIGNIIFNTGLAYLAQNAYDYIAFLG